MRALLQKFLKQKKYLLYGAIATASLLLPTSFAFADGPSVLAGVMTTILIPFHYLVMAMGTLMGVTMYYTIVRMGYYIHQLAALQIAWELFRDLGNILLVFGFIAIGVATILDNATYGAKKALPKLLIIAVLLNFSLFFSEFIVDTGNVFATQFYSSINGGKLPNGKFTINKEPISSSVMTVLKTTGLYNNKVPTLKAGPTIELTLLYIIMFIIMSFVFGAIAIILITRFVVLIFLFIVSPIGFIGLAGIPLISEYGKKWWKALTDQTLLAPILMLFLLVVTKMIQSNFIKISGNGTLASVVGSTSGVTSVANILLVFAVVVGLLFTSLIVAKSLSAKAASFAIGASRKMMARTFGLAVGGSARIIRGTTRRVAGDNKFSRGIGHLMRPIERSNFDVIGKLGGKLPLGVDDKISTSYRHISTHLPLVGKEGVLEKVKQQNLAEMSEEKSEQDRRDAERNIDKATKDKERAKEDIEQAEQNIKQAQKTGEKQKEADGEKQKEEAGKKLGTANGIISDNLTKLSAKEVAQLGGIQKGVASLAQNLSPEKFAMLMKSDSLTEQQKTKLSEQRYAPIDQAVASDDSSTIRAQSPKDLEQYAAHSPHHFASIGALVSDSQAEYLQKSGHLSATQRAEFKESRKARFSDPDKVKVEEIMSHMNTKEIAKLSDDIIEQEGVLNAIPFEKIVGLLDNPGDLSTKAHEALINHVHVQIDEHPDTKKGKRFKNLLGDGSDPTNARAQVWGYTK